MAKKALLIGAAFGALTAGSALAADVPYVPPPQVFTPPPAPQTVQAHVELYLGFTSFEYAYDEEDSYSETAFLFGGAGRANVPFQNGWNLQIDAQGDALAWSGGKSDPQFGGYAHLYYRDPASHALGLFGGANYWGPQVYTVGVEGQMYWPQFTLYGQAALSSVQAFGASATAVQLRGEGQWFFTDNIALLGDLMWTHVSADGDPADILTVAGTLIHRFDGPISGFVRGRWDHTTAGSFTSDQWSVVGGVRISADQAGSTDKSHRRTGPAMDVLPLRLGTCLGICEVVIVQL